MGRFSFVKILQRQKADDKKKLIVKETSAEKQYESTQNHHVSRTAPLYRRLELPFISTFRKYHKMNEKEESKANNAATIKQESNLFLKLKRKGNNTKELLDTRTLPSREKLQTKADKCSIPYPSVDRRQTGKNKSSDYQAKLRGTQSLFDLRDYGTMENREENSIIKEAEVATDVICVGDGYALVTDMKHNRLIMLNAAGVPSVIFHHEDITDPSSIVLTDSGEIAITSGKTKHIIVLSREGDVIKTFSHENLQKPMGLAFMKNGNFVVTDVVSETVSIFNDIGEIIKCFECKEHPFICPRYVTTSPDGAIIVSDAGANCLKVFDKHGVFKTLIGGFGSGDGLFHCPLGVTTDNDGNIIVADRDNNRVSLFNSTGSFVCHLLTKDHGLFYPQGVSLSKDLTIFVTYGMQNDIRIAAFKVKPASP